MSANNYYTTFSDGVMRVCGHIPRACYIRAVIVRGLRAISPAAPPGGAIMPRRAWWWVVPGVYGFGMGEQRPPGGKSGVGSDMYIYYNPPIHQTTPQKLPAGLTRLTGIGGAGKEGGGYFCKRG